MSQDTSAGRPMPRRDFLIGLGAAAGAAALPAPLSAKINPSAGENSAGIPMRVLGRTGQAITIVGLGSAPIGQSRPGVAEGVAVYRAALDAGINYVDTAHNYDDAERYLGELVPAFRDRIFLVTKALPRSSDPKTAVREMEQQFEQSLRLLKTDHVDLLHIHSVGDKSPEMILAPGGPMDFVKKMKDKGLTRFIGITGHNRINHFVPVIETGEVDALMVTLNFADYHQYAFEEQVLPAARKHGCGILAMKVFGGHVNNAGGYSKKGPAKMPSDYLQRALRYSLGIEGVASAVLGVYDADEVKQNVEWAKAYKPLSKKERLALRETGSLLAREWGPRFGPAHS